MSMSMSALLSILHGAGRQQLSASTAAARQSTGSYVLRIDGYTKVSKMVDESMRSDTFNVGGHGWRLLYYPNGCGEEHEGSHVSLFLEHDGRRSWDDEDATTKAQASILDQAGVPSYTRTMPDLVLRDLPRGWRDFIISTSRSISRTTA